MKRVILSVLASSLTPLSCICLGQTIGVASISRTVRDSTGATVPRVLLSVLNTYTGVRTATTKFNF